MGKRNYDVLEKEVEKYPELCADILNAFVHDGKQCVKPERLRMAETETLYRDQAGELRNQLEDLARYEVNDNGEVQMLYLLANQSTVDERMILRKCGYTGGYYRSQYQGQELQTCPVMELVLYWGQDRWKASGSVKEFYRDKEVSESAWRYIDNEQLHVFEMRYLPRETIEKFSSDMRVVVEYINDRHNPAYMSLPIRHVDCVLELIRLLSGDERYGELLEYLKECDRLERSEEEEAWTMCDLMDEAMGKGREEGICALINTCKDFGASFEDTVRRLKDSFKLTESVALQDMAKYW